MDNEEPKREWGGWFRSGPLRCYRVERGENALLNFQVAKLYNANEFQLEMEGSAKFDGCMNFSFGTRQSGSIHTCETAELFEIVHTLRLAQARIVNQMDWDCADLGPDPLPPECGLNGISDESVMFCEVHHEPVPTVIPAWEPNVVTVRAEPQPHPGVYWPTKDAPAQLPPAAVVMGHEAVQLAGRGGGKTTAMKKAVAEAVKQGLVVAEIGRQPIVEDATQPGDVEAGILRMRVSLPRPPDFVVLAMDADGAQRELRPSVGAELAKLSPELAEFFSEENYVGRLVEPEPVTPPEMIGFHRCLPCAHGSVEEHHGMQVQETCLYCGAVRIDGGPWT